MRVNKPIAVLIGFIGKIPLAGMSLYNLHYLCGLQELGYDVFYVERENERGEYYDPSTDSMTDCSHFATEYAASALADHGVGPDRFCVIDAHGVCHGAGWNSVEHALAKADFVLNIADATWFEQLGSCSRRAFVDGDPLFTQAAMLVGGRIAEALTHYVELFSYGSRIGKADCTVPSVNRIWRPTRAVVSTANWTVERVRDMRDLPISTVMNWSASSEVQLDGVRYGQKGRAMVDFLDLPRRTRRRLLLAVGGTAPRTALRDAGWGLANPLAATRTIKAYSQFIAGSLADLGIAKHAYVASRSGWFSDRSTCYLASGRPVLHQDTGFTDWLDVSRGVLPFTDPDSLLAAIESLEANYVAHAEAAREIAETHFEARTVIGRMLDDAGFR